ncbi:MAG: hypothetical protein GOVbin1807_11 [Prokaryotic dsDNA virus sp.]|nr:MAG: hypothetical protein GOVbin1807_11 [Prokaryotic dsDNA virus sp.]
MQVGDLVRFKRHVVDMVCDGETWIGLVVESSIEHQFEGVVAMIQWMCYNTPTPEYVDDLEVLCE